jgi:putative PIN family toxin of toxin-antitoxin system
MPRIAIDSNVLVSALHFGGTPEALLLLANEGRVELFVSPFILAETARVLKSKLGWTDKAVRDTIALIREVVTVVEPTRTVDAVPHDPTDNHILECAVHARADFLATGDKRHLLPLGTYEGIKIVTPRECLDALEHPPRG